MESIKLGDTVEVMSYGTAIRGTVTQIGFYTKKPSQMRRHDNGKLRAIVGSELRKVEG